MISNIADELYPRALDAGIKPCEFWDYSLIEISDLIEADERKCLEELKRSVIADCDLGRIISGNVSNILGGVNEIVKPWDIYPELFEQEKQAYEQEKQQTDIVHMKESRQAYVQEYNARRHRREV